MSILVTGATGTIGSLIVQRLADPICATAYPVTRDLRSRSSLQRCSDAFLVPAYGSSYWTVLRAVGARTHGGSNTRE
jgi:nucleoside-diphosphate-sugar epimerase